MSQVNRASPDTERSLPAVAALRWPTKIATSAKEKIDREHGLYQWGFPRLLAAVLDSPDHLAC